MNGAPSICPRCNTPLPPGVLACPNCGQLVYVDRLNAIAAQATAIEPHNPLNAAAIWQQCLPLLPENSQQHAAVRARISDLSSGFATSPLNYARPGGCSRPAPRNDASG
jgi:uncharacterized Zn finger protein (UPF0148 family)